MTSERAGLYIDQRFPDPADKRAFLIFYARTMLREARARRGQPGIDWMLRGAAKARRQAAAIDEQRDLFEGMM